MIAGPPASAPEAARERRRGRRRRSPGSAGISSKNPAAEAYSQNMARRLSQADLSLVVQRAAELQVVDELPRDTLMDEDTVREILRDAGVSDHATDQALAEWRKG